MTEMINLVTVKIKKDEMKVPDYDKLKISTRTPNLHLLDQEQ